MTVTIDNRVVKLVRLYDVTDLHCAPYAHVYCISSSFPSFMSIFRSPNSHVMLDDFSINVKDTVIKIYSATQKDIISMDVLQGPVSKPNTSLEITALKILSDMEFVRKHVPSVAEHVMDRASWKY